MFREFLDGKLVQPFPAWLRRARRFALWYLWV
jgi:hypothetical protein